MDIKSLRSKSRQVLEKELNEAQSHLKQLQFSLSSNQLGTVRDVRKTKQLIARIQTLLNEQNATQA
jgi:ribosomal protein L29